MRSLCLSAFDLAVSVAREDLSAFVLLSLVSAACFLLTYFVYRRPRGQQRRRRTGTVLETMDELAEALGESTNSCWTPTSRGEWTSVRVCFHARDEDKWQQSCAWHQNNDREGYYDRFSSWLTEKVRAQEEKSVPGSER